MSPATARINPLLTASNLVSDSEHSPDVYETARATIEACQRGDESAQRRLYDGTHQHVYRLMFRMVGPQDASDVTQQAFLQVFRKIGQFAGRAQLETWIYRVAINEALQHIRRSKRARLRTLEQEPMDRSPSNYENVGDKELLEEALNGLDPDLRSAFLLREVEGLSYREIAEALRIPEGTVGSRLNRARGDLRKRLIELGWEQ